jgi:primosomal protein N'
MEVESKTSETTGKTKNNYFHKGECWEQHLKRKNFIVQEMKEKDELNEVIKSIHDIKYDIPPRIWELIQDLRNGTNRYVSFWKKKYKAGVPYSVMAEAYRMSKDNIEWAKLNKRFKTKEIELSYCLRTMQSRIEDAYRKIKRTEQSKQIAKATEIHQVEQLIENRQVEFKKQKSEFDISHILGDD